MRKTATEWLFEKLCETPKDKLTWNAILYKAKQIEKQQLKEMYLKGIENYDPTFKKKL
jgi:hypothetical protein